MKFCGGSLKSKICSFSLQSKMVNLLDLLTSIACFSSSAFVFVVSPVVTSVLFFVACIKQKFKGSISLLFFYKSYRFRLGNYNYLAPPAKDGWCKKNLAEGYVGKENSCKYHAMLKNPTQKNCPTPSSKIKWSFPNL